MKHGTPSQANRGPKNPGRSLWINDAVRIVVNVLLELLITPVIKGVSEKKAASVATTIVNWCTGQG